MDHQQRRRVGRGEGWARDSSQWYTNELGISWTNISVYCMGHITKHHDTLITNLKRASSYSKVFSMPLISGGSWLSSIKDALPVRNALIHLYFEKVFEQIT